MRATKFLTHICELDIRCSQDADPPLTPPVAQSQIEDLLSIEWFDGCQVSALLSPSISVRIQRYAIKKTGYSAESQQQVDGHMVCFRYFECELFLVNEA